MGTSRHPDSWAGCWSHGSVQFVRVTELALCDMHFFVPCHPSIKVILISENKQNKHSEVIEMSHTCIVRE